jgi:hypothetical protein
MMPKLKLPIVKNLPPVRKRLTMDEYLGFIIFNASETMTSRMRKTRSRQRILPAVQAPFKLK